ncbi:hypothetical protein FMN50_11250 [Rhodobacterales bacterium]|nr:hypothetical protein FMN50_11250 [Rhodobacterales bacterium]
MLTSLLLSPHNKRAKAQKRHAIELTLGSDMFFLLRTAFWLTLVLVLIPLGSEQDETTGEMVDPVSAFLAAQATVSDLGGFCHRNPQACETGSNALTVIGSRARDGARMVYEFLDDQVAETDGGEAIVTGATPTASEGEEFSGDTYRQPDLNTVSNMETAFGPVPRPKPRSGS